MDFPSRELRFGLTDRDQYDEQAVKDALKAQGFPGAELRSGPS